MPSEARARIHRTILSAASDPEVNGRLAAIIALRDVGDTTDLPVLNRIGQEDSVTTINRGRTVYPVRDAARRAIAAISRR